jgi:hypothetical protein
MQMRQTAISVLLLLGLAQGAAAQQQIDVSRLPVDVSRIQRQLRQSAIREERDGPNLRYFVDVYARAPQIELFSKQENLRTGPVPYGGPTHGQMLEVMTPREYRAPGMDLGSLFRWAAGKSRK